ncbi:MAG: 50S ribosomal protein L15 [Proteobacteria bacterium]|nr:50S ribosomal protein L15 [Cystobacterineae bacterium]MCL2258618.1 50S ribosomal protein L15 [Cystobacterineae bacterium]MCL2315022.1 50S ribosomal protein L15 [Pseudomonadota bacterium]
MDSLHTLKAPAKSSHRKKRVGRGQASGWGKTAGRGGKGQKARTGNMHFEGFEGGQSPLQRRMPKLGFHSPNRKVFALVGLGELGSLAVGTIVDEALMRAKGWVRGRVDGIKILANGEVKVALTVKAHRFSKAAKEAIIAAGGKVEELPMVVHAEGAQK